MNRGPGDFADGAAKSGLLSIQESLDIFLYFTASDKPELQFPTTRRKKCLKRCLRFSTTLRDHGDDGWSYDDPESCDSIQFSADKSISVVGFGLYGSFEDSVEFPVTIELKRDGPPITM